MNKINKFFSVLSQFSIKQSFIVMFSAIVELAYDMIPRDFLMMKKVLNIVYQYDNKSKKVGNCNLLQIDHGLKNAPFKILLRRESTDFHVFYDIFIKDQFKPLTDLIHEMSYTNVSVVVDVGAYVGCSSVYFKLLFPSASIYAIEPDLKNHAILNQNVSINNYSDIILIKDALWTDNSLLKIGNDFADGREWAIRVKPAGTQFASNMDRHVKGITLDDISAMYLIKKIDILKINIEGAEKYLFNNAATAAKLLSKVNILYLDVHPQEIEISHVEDLVRQIGFQTRIVDETVLAYRNNLIT